MQKLIEAIGMHLVNMCKIEKPICTHRGSDNKIIEIYLPIYVFVLVYKYDCKRYIYRHLHTDAYPYVSP